MKAWIDSLGGACGVGMLSGFDDPPSWCVNIDVRDVKRTGGGIGYTIAGFIDNLKCKETYEEIQRDYDIVFQSPVKRNKNRGNDFFFIVFKIKD